MDNEWIEFSEATPPPLNTLLYVYVFHIEAVRVATFLALGTDRFFEDVQDGDDFVYKGVWTVTHYQVIKFPDPPIEIED